MHYTECDSCGKRRNNDMNRGQITRLSIQHANTQVVFDVCSDNEECSVKLLTELGIKWIKARELITTKLPTQLPPAT